MGEMSAAAEPEPTFDAVLEALAGRPHTKAWAVRHRRELKKAFDDALEAAKASENDLQPFSAESAAQAIWHLARFRGARFPVKLARPCCSKKPFIFPFCNPAC